MINTFNKLHPKARRAVIKYAVFRAFAGAGFATPFFVVFMVGNGVTYTDIALGASLMAVVTVALEMPSGYIADAVGRRRTMFLSQVFLGLGTVGYVVADGTLDVLALYLAFGIGTALRSGAGTAWFYDTLKQYGDEEQFAAVSGKIGSFVKYIITVTMLFGGILYLARPVSAIATGAAANLLAAPVVLTLPAGGDVESDDDTVGLREAVALTKRFLTDPAVRTLLLVTALASGAIYTGSKYVQPVAFGAIPDAGYSVAGFTVSAPLLVAGAYAVLEFSSGIALNYAETVQLRLGLRGTVAVAYGGSALCMLVPFIAPVLTIPAVIGMISLQSLASPGVSQYINERAESVARATINSAKSFLTSALRVPVILGSGVVADTVSPTVALAGVGTVFLASAGLIVLLDRPVFGPIMPSEASGD